MISAEVVHTLADVAGSLKLASLGPEIGMFPVIAEDDPRILEGLADTLESEGYGVCAAADGRQALAEFKRQDVDLVLLDIMMPGMSGVEVLQQIKADESLNQVSVIMISALDDQETIDECLQLGAEDYITKPFNNEELLSRVNTHLKLQAAFRQIQEQNSKLKELNATKDNFFSIIAHDLRNPFNGLLVLDFIVNLIRNEHTSGYGQRFNT